MAHAGGGGPPTPINTADLISAVLTCWRCSARGCTQVPSFALIGEQPTFCSQHKRDGMVQVLPVILIR
ncbi:unnamed protein product [Discosporangium mesarthrocarpum]